MIYIVVPCYNEEAVLKDTTEQLVALLPRLSLPARILYVDDGSRDATWDMIEAFAKAHPEVCGIRLAHNVGHQNALWAGMEHVADRADAIISIDADLQDDIEVIVRMVDDFRDGADVVYGVRRDRTTDSFFKRATALCFYKAMNSLGTGTVYNHADFRLLSHRALRALMDFPERNLFLRGMVPMLGFHTKMEYYDRLERKAGETKYPLSKMLAFAADGITSFSIKPLRSIFFCGVLFLLVAVGVIVWALIEYFDHNTIAGWTSLLISIWFVGGCLLMAMGVMGEYIGKMYQEVKRRPRYFVMDEAGNI